MSYCSGLLMQNKCKADFVQRWVIACWTCLGKLAPRGQRHSCVYLSSEWMWLCFRLTMWLLRCLCFSSKSSFPFSKRSSTFHSGKLNMDMAYLRKCFRVFGSCGTCMWWKVMTRSGLVWWHCTEMCLSAPELWNHKVISHHECSSSFSLTCQRKFITQTVWTYN